VEYTDQYVELAKILHSTHVPAGSFTRIQDVLHELADKLDKWCTPEEIELIHSLIDSIPEADTVTHNDLHPGNIMIHEGELVLIDMPQVTMGPPICDLVAIFRDMISAPQKSASIIEGSVGMPAEMIQKCGNLFFMKYTGITDPKELEEYYKKLGLLYAFNVVLMPGTGSEQAMARADAIMNNLLRPVVIPNAQTIRYLFQTM
jgi:aminoglycoside phosphotransferase (APT) family kinase protein